MHRFLLARLLVLCEDTLACRVASHVLGNNTNTCSNQTGKTLRANCRNVLCLSFGCIQLVVGLQQLRRLSRSCRVATTTTILLPQAAHVITEMMLVLVRSSKDQSSSLKNIVVTSKETLTYRDVIHVFATILAAIKLARHFGQSAATVHIKGRLARDECCVEGYAK